MLKKLIAILLVLTFVISFSFISSAEDGEKEVDAVDTGIEVYTYEIVDYDELCEKMLDFVGYTVDDIDMSYNKTVYGDVQKYYTTAGERTWMYYMKDGLSVKVSFNVIQAPELIEKDVTLKLNYKKVFSIESAVNECGYTAEDVTDYVYMNGLNISYNSPDMNPPFEFSTTSFSDMNGDILLNMKDKQSIMLHLTVLQQSREEFTEEYFENIPVAALFIFPFLGPVMAFAAPAFLWPLIFTPLLTPLFWGLGIYKLIVGS